MHHDKILRSCWGDRINHPLFITVLLLLFQLEGKKELHWEVKSWGLVERGFNWQHFNSSLMPQPTDLFSPTILIFVKFNMLTKFNPLLHEYWVNTCPYMIFQWSKGIVSPPPPQKVRGGGGAFYKKKLFRWVRQFVLGKFLRGLFCKADRWSGHAKGRGVSEMQFPVTWKL